jgi:hypothetical protein
MPTTFSGLFLFSTALSLVCTFMVLGLLKLVRLARPSEDGRGIIAGQ